MLGFKKITSLFCASQGPGNLIIHFRHCIFSLFGNHTPQLLEQVSSSQMFFNGWELYKVGDSRRDAGFDCLSELLEHC
jgi:hypothetical protein